MKFLVEGYSAGMRGLSLLLGFLSLISVGAEDDEEIVDELGFSRAPYVQLATTEGIHVIWRTVEKIEPVVKVGLSFDDLSVVFDEDAVRERKVADDEEDLEGDPTLLHSGPEKTRQFEAALTDLQPNTRYFYAVYDEDERLTPKDESYYFDTLPEFGTDKDAYFWVVGDSGTGQERQSEVHEAMLDYTKKVGRPIDFYLHVGDMAYSKGTDDQFQRKFFEMYEETIRNTVVWPAIGNHEAASAPAKGVVVDGGGEDVAEPRGGEGADQPGQRQRIGEEAKPLLPRQREKGGEVGAQQRFVEAHQAAQTKLIELMAQHQLHRPERLPTPLRQGR